jgi:serine/threonine protein kinase/tetratricopeptide (TPR) repeat protein
MSAIPGTTAPLEADSPNPAGEAESEALLGALAEEMIRRWKGGDRVCAEELLDRHPELWQQAEEALQLVYEEICLRRQEGQSDVAEQVLRRFPQWRRQLEVMLECHRLLEQPPCGPCFPQAGETLVGYSLLRELGRGGAGRVFLAGQPALANRPVVVKLIPRQGKEHLHLARLQHTHIVPLYSVQDDADSNLRILCMPYFGGTTLDRVLTALAPFPPGERTSAQLKAVLSTSGVEATGPARRIFDRLSFVQAICWVGVYLAEALQYAHDSGLLHLDLKPSNVLIAADGQPMLLDFHLARAPLEAGRPAAEGLGGTPAYMPREQQLALAAAARGEPIPLAVDRRADVYALGAVLYEALGGRLLHEPGVRKPRHLQNPQVTPGLSDILEKCLATDAVDRYSQAADLAADLRRNLGDQPLVGVRNRSWVERWQKWRRRHPPIFRAWLWLTVLACAAAALGAGALSHWKHVVDEGKAVQAEDQRLKMLNSLHALAEQVRGLYTMDSVPSAKLQALERSCRDFWNKREFIKDWLKGTRAPQATNDLVDLAVFAADLQVRLAAPADKDRARAQAVRDLNEAEQLFGASAVLDHERSRQQAGSKDSVSAPRTALAARAPWEHCGLARSLLRDGNLPAASEHLRQALELQPRDFWANFYYGICAHRQGNHTEAVGAFSVCIGAAPGVAGCYFNRGLAYAALGLDEPARRDYDQALRLDPLLAAAALNRGMLYHRARRFAEAEADLRHALSLGVDPATGYYDLAVVQSARRDAAGARQSLQQALAHDPHHPQALKLWHQFR